MIESKVPNVGIFWFVGTRLLACGCNLDDAESADDWLDYPGGHSEYWDRWRAAGGTWLKRHGLPADIMSTEYDEHPRGRNVFNRKTCRFLLYADRRLQTDERIAEIRNAFALPAEEVEVLSDPHYQ